LSDVGVFRGALSCAAISKALHTIRARADHSKLEFGSHGTINQRLLIVGGISLLYLWIAFDNGVERRQFARELERTCCESANSRAREAQRICEEIQSKIDNCLFKPDYDSTSSLAFSTQPRGTRLRCGTSVDAASVRFGADANEAGPVASNAVDVNRDGLLDLLLRFRVQETGIQCGQIFEWVSGRTVGGELIFAGGPIVTVECG